MPKMKNHTTPMQAIRRKCLWCCDGSHTEVRLCPAVGCPLHEYRSGKRPESATRTPIQAIKAKCRDCYGMSAHDVKGCSGLKLMDGPCTLHQFREGKNPNVSAETRARQREAMERRFLTAKGPSSPLMAATEIDGRGFVHGDGEGLEIDNPIFDPAAVGSALHARR